MALEAVALPQDLFGCAMNELYNMGGAAWCYAFGDEGEEKGVALDCKISGGGGGGMHGNLDVSSGASSSLLETASKDGALVIGREATAGGRKRRRTKVFKNQEEVENQRMTHIAVERNRRKQMNEYLAVLQSLMPASYVQRGDQASIIGGAINFVKELEQLVQSLEARKRVEKRMDAAPFADFFTFPQYSTTGSRSASNDCADEGATENRPAVADIEVTMVESHANLKVLSRRRPKQLLKMVLGLQNLRLTTLHLNVTSIAEMAFYSFSLKVWQPCKRSSSVFLGCNRQCRPVLFLHPIGVGGRRLPTDIGG
ncbi:transcription factor bHLH94-like isoform X1 [Musa acuminata AAA Group]|uniref:transcription factor bHLH94-like isoform X1 n=1 Tax=Musa acuminata AAA Group TaxID=214697 RepID=UPI0031D73C79